MDGGFIPIKLRDFISGTAAASDLYICVEGQRYIKVLHKGQSFDHERIKRYEEHDIDVVYLKPEDFRDYVTGHTQIAEKLSKKSNGDVEKCVRFINRIADAVMQELLHTEMHQEALMHARSLTSSIVLAMQQKPNFLAVFRSLEELGEDFARHSIGTGMLASALAMKMKWGSEKTLQIVQCGGMLHDVGFRELPRELSEKPRAEMTLEEIALYESHPFRGAQLLRSVSFMPSEVVQIVYEHHELASGSGFPRNLKSERLYPLARVVSLADICCHQMLKSPTNPEPRQAKDIAMYIESIHSHDYPTTFWDALYYLLVNDSVKRKTGS